MKITLPLLITGTNDTANRTAIGFLVKKGFKSAVFALLMLTAIAPAANAQRALDNIGLNSSSPVASAYSLRKMGFYAFSCITAVNAGGTLEVGFDASGELDTAALKTFAGGGDVFVSTWYDQTGRGRNMVQTNASLRPRIVTAGKIERVNGRPAIYFNNTYLTANTLDSYSFNVGATMVAFAKGNGATSTLISRTGTRVPNTENFINKQYPSPFDFTNSGGDAYTGNAQTLTGNSMRATGTPRFDVSQYTPASIYSFTMGPSADFVAYLNGTEVGRVAGNDYLDGGAPMNIGYRNDGVLASNMWVGEIVLFNGYITTERQTVEASQKDYFVKAATIADLSTLNVNPGNVNIDVTPGAGNYTAIVSPKSTTVTFTPAAKITTAVITVNGSRVATGATSAAIPFNDNDVIPIVVTSVDGATTKTYNITVIKRVPYTLDKIGLTAANPPAAAYSLRRLSSQYTGRPIRVRRTLDGGVTEINFAADGSLDLDFLKSWCGNGDGYITTWYDQTGLGVNMVQTDNDKQPQIVKGGVVLRLNGRPTASFGSSYMQTAQTTVFDAATTMLAFAKGDDALPSSLVTKTGTSANQSTNYPSPFDFTNSTGDFTVGDAASRQFTSINASSATPKFDVSSNVAPSIYGFTLSQNNGLNMYLNGDKKGTIAIPAYADRGGAMMIGNRNDLGGRGNMRVSEILMFNKEINNTDLPVLQTALKNYYVANGALTDLSSLLINPGTISPQFNAGTKTYTATVAKTVLSLTVVASAQSTYASVTVNGVPTNSGVVNVTLNDGLNVLLVVVTGSDGVTKNTYTLNVTRLGGVAVTYPNNIPVLPVNQAINTITPVSVNVNTSGTYAAVAPETFYSGGVYHITADAAGNTYFNNAAYGLPSAIVKRTPGGVLDTLVTGEQYIRGLTVDNATGDLYVSESVSYGNGGRIIKIANGSHAVTEVKVFTGNTFPLHIASNSKGAIYIASSNDIIKLDLTTLQVTNIVNTGAIYPGSDVKADGYGNIYYSTYANGIIKMPMNGDASQVYMSPPNNNTYYFFDIDASGNLYVIGNNGLAMLRSGTTSLVTIDASVNDSNYREIAVDNSGTVYMPGFNSQTALKVCKPFGGYYIDKPLPVGLVFNNNTGGLSGTPTIDDQGKTYTVTVYNPSGTKAFGSFNLSVLGDARLSALSIDKGTITPSFDADNLMYAASVVNSVSSINVTPIAKVATSVITINNTPVSSGSAQNVALSVGNNSIVTKVSSPGGLQKTYTLTINRLPSTVKTLTGITLSSGSLSPAFDPAVNTYTVTVSTGSAVFRFKPLLTDATATISINGATVSSDSTYSVPLTYGANPITVIVTAQDNSQNTYTITVTRLLSSVSTLSNLIVSQGTLSPVFDPAVTGYATTVTNTTALYTFKPILTDSTATIAVNGATFNADSTYSLPLSYGVNTINVVVAAQDNSQTTYTITVTKPISSVSTLSNLIINQGTLSPLFDQAVTGYAATVNVTDAVFTFKPTLTDGTATVTVSGATFNADSTYSVPLSYGINTINVLVTAQDNSQKTYTITVTRPPASVAGLNNILISSGALSPGFNTDIYNYTATVGMGDQYITMACELTDPGASIKINGNLVSNRASENITLTDGANTITIVVTAADSTQRTYTVVITKPSAAQIQLSNLTVNSGTLYDYYANSDGFHPGGSYFINSANTLNGAQYVITPTLADPTSTITINGTPVANNAAYTTRLEVGYNNIFYIIVTSADGSNSYNYILQTVYPGSNESRLASLTLSSGRLSPVFNADVHDYIGTVPTSETSIRLTPVAKDTTAQITINGQVLAGVNYMDIPLAAGDNPVSITVSGITPITYNLVIKSSDALPVVYTTQPLSQKYYVNQPVTLTAVVQNAVSYSWEGFFYDNQWHNFNDVYGSQAGDSHSLTYVYPANLWDGRQAVRLKATSATGEVSYSDEIYLETIVNDNTLSSLTTSAGVLSPVFNPTVSNYTIALPNAVTSLTLTGVAADPNVQSVAYNGTLQAAGSPSQPIDVFDGDNNIVINIATLNNQPQTQTYKIKVTRAATASSASLVNLTMSPGALGQAFVNGVNNYTATVTNDVSSISLTPYVSYNGATVTVNGVSVTPGQASQPITLTTGFNQPIKVTVTSANGTVTGTYNVMVNRHAAAAQITLQPTDQTAILPQAITFTAQANTANVAWQINAYPSGYGPIADPAITGIYTDTLTIPKSVSFNYQNRTFRLAATNATGLVTYSNGANLIRDAGNTTLLSIGTTAGALSPAFNQAIDNYTLNVRASAIKLTPVTLDDYASVQILVNGNYVGNYRNLYPANIPEIPLLVGENTVTLNVQSSNYSNTHTYTVTVTNRGTSAAVLQSIAVNYGAVALVNQTTGIFTATVLEDNVRLTSTATDAGAVITVGGNVVVSNSASPPLPVVMGDNDIPIVVTSSDGTVTKNYIARITRTIPGSNTVLANISTYNGQTAVYNQATGHYTITVPSTRPGIGNYFNFILNPADPYARASMVGGNSPYLELGANVLTVQVTAADGQTKQNYTLDATVYDGSDLGDFTSLTYTTASTTQSVDLDKTNSQKLVTVNNTDKTISFTGILKHPEGQILYVNSVETPSGVTSAALPLSVGLNVYNVITNTAFYNMRITRPSSTLLTALSTSEGTLSPAFSPADSVYTVSVPSSTLGIFLSPTLQEQTATLTVNGVTTPSGGRSGIIPLAYGDNVIKVVVAVPRSTDTKTYTVTVHRSTALPVSANATLTSLIISPGSLSPSFATGTTGYTAGTVNSESVIITPTTTDSNATVTINGAAATSGSPLSVGLTAGSNTITVAVTAADGTNINNYIIALTRAVPAAPSLSYTGPQTYTKGVTITPLAPSGSGVDAFGYAVGKTTISAAIHNPTGIARDAAGNIYAAEATGGAIYQLPFAGGAPVLYGSGFNTPFHMTTDATGNLYIADIGDAAIKMIPAGGGTPVPYAIGSVGSTGVAVDAAGNIYATNSVTHALYKIPAGGGSAAVLSDNFTQPYDVTVDKAGNLYVADVSAQNIQKITPAGVQTTYVSGLQATSIKADAEGNLFTADAANNAIVKITAGSTTPVTISSGFNAVFGVVPGEAGKVYVSDNGSQLVQQLNPIGGYFIAPVLPAGLSMDSNTGIISGTPIAISPLTSYTVIGYNSGGSAQSVVSIKVTAPDASLASLTLSTGTAVSHPTATSYTATIPYVTGAFTITPTAIDANAEIRVAGNVVVSGSPSQSLTLGAPVGSTLTLPIIVTAPDGTTIKSYTITVTRDATGAPNNAGITRFGLSPSATLVQVPNTNNFTTTVDGAVSSVLLISTVSVAGTTVSVNGVPVTSGVASDPIALNTNGATVITAVATALNGTTKTYTITVSKTGSSNTAMKQISLTPGSSIVQVPNTSNYTTTVSSGISSVKQTFTTADSGATIKVNGVTVPSGTASGDIALNATGTTTITTVVTAANGTTTKTYTLTISKTGSSNASLIRIGLNPSSTLSAIANTNNFTTTIDGSVTSVQQVASTSDAGAVMVVNGVVTASGVPSAPIALNATGTTVITTVVTAENGVTAKTYTVTISKTGSSNATLASFGLNPSATFVQVPTTSNFTTTVNHAVNQVQLKLRTTDSNATMLVNGVAAISGMPTGYLALNATGTTTIPVVVTAANGVTTKTYNFTISRTGSSDVAVDHFGLSPSATIVQEPNTANYSTTVNAATGTVQLKTVLKDAGATLKVNGISVIPGAATNPIALNVSGVTNISVVVTAENGFTTKTYTIAISKTGSSNATILLFKLNPATTLTQIPNTGNFTATVPASVTSVQLIPKASDADAMISVNGETVVSEAASSSIPLNAGATTVITTVVTAGNGTTTKTYTLTITSTPSPESGFNTLESTGIVKISNDNISNTLFVHQALSPNGDGQNDVLLVDGLQNYSNNHLSIMNAAGQLVFETLSYNTSGNVFDGHSNKTGTMQKPGTYYYSLEYKDGNDTKRKTGYIILKY